MNYQIETEFTKEEIQSLILRIYQIINSEKKLSYRSKDELKSLLTKKEICIIRSDSGDILAFLIKELIYDRYFELGAFYVQEDRRGESIFRILVDYAIGDDSATYLLYTFQNKIIEIFKNKYKFEVISLSDLKFSIRFRIIMKRISFKRIKSIIEKTNSAKPTLMIKYPTE